MHKVLIIDDNPDLRNLVARMLVKLGYEVREAANGIRGEEQALTWYPDVILIDLMMPLQDGYSTVANLRREGYEGKIIVVSALPGIWDSPHTAIAGTDGFLSKPISYGMLRDCLDLALVETITG